MTVQLSPQDSANNRAMLAELAKLSNELIPPDCPQPISAGELEHSYLVLISGPDTRFPQCAECLRSREDYQPTLELIAAGLFRD